MLNKGIVKSNGFTLVEVLIVVMIIAVLSGAVYTYYFDIREKAKYAKANQDIIVLSEAIRITYVERTSENEPFGTITGGETGQRADTIFTDSHTAMLIESKLTRKFNEIFDPWGAPYKFIFTKGTKTAENPTGTYDMLEIMCVKDGQARKDIYSLAKDAVLKHRILFDAE